MGAPRFPRVASAALWLVGPYIGGRYSDLRVLAIDADSDDAHDSTATLGDIRCPTLVASGGHDTAYPPGLVRDLSPGFRMPGTSSTQAGHMGPGKVFGEDACSFLADGA